MFLCIKGGGSQPAAVGLPVEAGTGVRLATRGDVLMAGNPIRSDQRISPLQGQAEGDQTLILNRCEWLVVRTLKFDTDGVVIAVFPPVKTRLASVPGALQTGNELGYTAIALDEKMRRHAQLGNLGKIGVLSAIKRATEELLDSAGAELTRRQTDVVNHQ